MLNLGGLSIKTNAVLAPMAGVTDLSFRLMCRKFGCEMATTEMVSSKAMHYNDKKTLSLLKTCDSDVPLAVQIFGSEEEIMAEAAEKLTKMRIASAIDINMGCPAPKIVNNGDGAALMKDINKAAGIIRAVVSATDLPVTVKFRKGWDPQSENYLEFGKMCQEMGAAAVTLHARFKSQFYSGEADISAISRLKKSLNIPVIANGDVSDREKISEMIRATGADAVMIGRGAMGNPFIFSDVKPDKSLIISTAIEHLGLLNELKGEHIGMLEARKNMAWYVKGMKHATVIKDKINTIDKYVDMKELLHSLEE